METTETNKPITTTVKLSIIVALGVAALLCMASCNKSTMFQQFEPAGKNGWHKDNAINFGVNVDDSIGRYNVIIDVRNEDTYPYQNLYLFVHSVSPDTVSMTDTLNCILADNQGRWLGSGIGSAKSLPFLYLPNVKFPRKGTYTFEIGQGMRETVLKGIRDIGIRVEKVE